METNIANVASDTVGSVIEKTDFSDVLVTENDTFDVTVNYYKDGNQLFVNGVDDNFDETKKCKEFKATFKYPDQADVSHIASASPKLGTSGEIDARDFMRLEFSRLLCLIRDWSLGRPIDNHTILSVNPKIIKGIIAAIREKIGVDGIV